MGEPEIKRKLVPTLIIRVAYFPFRLDIIAVVIGYFGSNISPIFKFDSRVK
jgi:hypothetical protein